MSISRKIRLIWFAFMMATFCYFIDAAFPNSNQNDFDINYYEINISIHPISEKNEGSVTVKATSIVENLTQITLDLYHTMLVTAVTGNSVGYHHDNDFLTIDLDRNYANNEQVSVTIYYSGKPSLSTGFNPMTFDRSRDAITISSESCPYYAHYWWPCKDQPDDKADSMDLKITVPLNLIVASNGVLVEVKNNRDGTKTHHWQVRNPIATYLVSFTTSNYKIIKDNYINSDGDTLQIMHFVYPEHYNLALVDFNNRFAGHKLKYIYILL